MPKKDLIRFGIIGCGAITEMAYLACFKNNNLLRLTCMVDKNESRSLSLAKGLDLCYAGIDPEAVYDYVDAVIVAVPNYLHFPMCKAFLEAGKHVLCEKPITLTSKECEELIFLASKYSLKLAVAHVRRFYRAAQKIKEIISSNELGAVESFDFEEGTIFSWPTVSGFFFDRRKAGGGVMMDIGVHLFDLLSWWLPYEVKYVSYEDDNLGGIEALAKIEIGFSNGIAGNLKISRLSVLRNSYSIHFEKGNIEWNPLLPNRIYLQHFSGTSRKVVKIKKETPVKDLVSDFVSAIQDNKTPFVSGEDALKAIQFIERCYRSRKLLPLEWLEKKENALCK